MMMPLRGLRHHSSLRNRSMRSRRRFFRQPARYDACMDPPVQRLIESLHRQACKSVLALTGGGTSAAGCLLAVPGGSRSILEVVVPYQEEALADFLGVHPESACSVATAQQMARRAEGRAAWLVPREAVAGISCTASLVTDRP